MGLMQRIIDAVLNRDAYISVEHAFRFNGEETEKILYAFSISIEKRKSLNKMSNIPWENAKELHKTLVKAKGTVEFQQGGTSCYEYIVIPRGYICRISKYCMKE